ncbi:MAG: hypothetical protein KGI37_06770 [Alphaproteobacteria bacterium]|nr:hypothetical protein [Alphaproteobacteria bacterium]
MQDDFEAALKRDAAALEMYRLQKIPVGRNSAEEKAAMELRAQIRIIPQQVPNFAAEGVRMEVVRRSIRNYYEAGEKDGRHGGLPVFMSE